MIMTFTNLSSDVSQLSKFMESFHALRNAYPEKRNIIFIGYVQQHPSVHIFAWRYGVPREPSIYYDTDKHCFVSPKSCWISDGRWRPRCIPHDFLGATFIAHREQIEMERFA